MEIENQRVVLVTTADHPAHAFSLYVLAVAARRGLVEPIVVVPCADHVDERVRCVRTMFTTLGHPDLVVATAPGCDAHRAPEYDMSLDADGATVDLREVLPRRPARRRPPVRMALLPGAGPELCAEGILSAGLDLAVAPRLGHAEAPSRCRPPGVARSPRVRNALVPSDGDALARAVLERNGWDIETLRAALGPEGDADAGHRSTRDALVEQLALAATLLAIVGSVPESRNATVRMAVDLLGD